MKPNLSPFDLTSLIQQALFERWLSELEIELTELVGISLKQLPELKYQDMFSAGYSPEETSRVVGLIIDELV